MALDPTAPPKATLPVPTIGPLSARIVLAVVLMALVAPFSVIWLPNVLVSPAVAPLPRIVALVITMLLVGAGLVGVRLKSCSVAPLSTVTVLVGFPSPLWRSNEIVPC